MYFDNFPVIPYDSVGKGYFKDVTNLLRRVGVRAKVKTNTMLFDTYDVKEGETPESIADKLYDDPELHWVILLVNNIADRYHQWPMNTPQFQSYVTEKYANPDATHHYEITQSSEFGFEVVSLGHNRLRAETAGIVACHILNIINEIND